MRPSRWATILNETDTWDTMPHDETENLLDKDLLLKIFLEKHDTTTGNKQFVGRIKKSKPGIAWA